MSYHILKTINRIRDSVGLGKILFKIAIYGWNNDWLVVSELLPFKTTLIVMDFDITLNTHWQWL